MELALQIANPAGNITALVTTPVSKEDYSRVAQQVLAFLPPDAPEGFCVEQMGFVVPPQLGGAIRIEMMGGEFCGNATRSVALLATRQTAGIEEVLVECSSIAAPISVTVDHDSRTTYAQMPNPVAWRSVDGGEFGQLGLVEFDGIAHVIATDVDATEENFNKIQSCLSQDNDYDALGVMFYTQGRLTPVVKVFATDTLFFEGSCGSGTTALGLWLSHKQGDVSGSYTVPQPSGLLVASVEFQMRKLRSIVMGGYVTMSPVYTLEV